jgi:Ca2+-binding RTX toxin-like protein
MRRTLALALLAPAVALLPAAYGTPAVAQQTCQGRTATIVGTNGDDDIDGTALPDVVFLGAGDDTFRGHLGDDVVCGGDGDDQLFGNAGNDSLDGDAGRDRIWGEADDDHVRGGTGNDLLRGGDGNDLIRGAGGGDLVVESAGDDQATGGKGKDVLSYRDATTSITVQWASGQVNGAGNDLVGHFERFVGSPQADVINGSSGFDDLAGGGGDDRVYGFGDRDLLRISSGQARGGAGNDLFVVHRTGRAFGQAGNDRFVLRGGTSRGGAGKDLFQVLTNGFGTANGERGADVISFEKVKRPVTASLGTGVARWGDRRVTMVSIAVLVGTKRADVLNGSRRADFIKGSGGDDRLRGQGGNDLLIGDRGFDIAEGGPGGDVCVTEVKAGCEA